MNAFEQQFWREYQRFLKVPLITETPHLATTNLAALAQQHPLEALKLLFNLDQHVIEQMAKVDISSFKTAIHAAFKQGGRIFLVGCGASGRMAMQLEYLWHKPKSVKAVIAGGDIALIEAVEGCEDLPAFAVRHLEALQLNNNDLVIGLSSGGESPFILGALQYALTICKQKPWLLYSNPKEILLARNPEHILSQCEGLSLVVGSMALTGSTRMQATTAMTLVLLLAFFDASTEVPILLEKLKQLPYADLAEFIQFEAKLYQKQQKVLYEVAPQYALSVLADTTERSPTFNLPTFEHDARTMPALTYMIVQGSKDKESALAQILLRAPEALNWLELPQTRMSYLNGYDLSEAYQAAREKIYLTEREHTIVISYNTKEIVIDVARLSLGFRQLLLRLVLVNHSTLVFGRLGFYQGNLMTYVKPSNFKLVDRAVRYIQFLAQVNYQRELPYQEVAEFVLKARKNLVEQQSIVAQALDFFCVKH